ncbi:MAG: XisH family protein [Chloroflexi bacterium]|nr:XisH family protein [Chloroflexota bacterium]
MPARDLYHSHVRNALSKDGWSVTDDPLRLRLGKKDMYIDLAAERVLWAEKGMIKIAVEIKSFLGASDLSDLHDALGQFVLYHDVLKELQPDRRLFLAVRDTVFASVFEVPIGQLLLKNERVQLLVFDGEQEVIVKWIPEIMTAS